MACCLLDDHNQKGKVISLSFSSSFQRKGKGSVFHRLRLGEPGMSLGEYEVGTTVLEQGQS